MASNSPVNQYLLPIGISLKSSSNKILFNLYVLLKAEHQAISFYIYFYHLPIASDDVVKQELLDFCGSDFLGRQSIYMEIIFLVVALEVGLGVYFYCDGYFGKIYHFLHY